MRDFFIEQEILLCLKSNSSDNCSHKYTKIDINSDDDLRLGKTLKMHNVVTLIRSVFNNNQKRIFRKMFIQTIYKVLYYDRIDVLIRRYWC